MKQCNCCGGLIPEEQDADIGVIDGQPCECNSEYIVIEVENKLPRGYPLFGKALRNAMLTTH